MLKNIGSNWLQILVGAAAIYILTPFIIHTLGNDSYGTWLLVTSLTGYLGLLVLGVPMASVRYLAEYVAQGDTEKSNKTIGTCAGLYLMLGGAALVVGMLLLALFHFGYEIPLVFRRQANVAFVLLLLHVALGFVSQVPFAILVSHRDFVLRNVVAIGGTLLRLFLTLSILAQLASLTVLAAIHLACLVFEFTLALVVVRRRYPNLRISLGDFDGAVLRRIFSFSMYVLVLGTAVRLSFETDSLVIGWFLTVGDIPFYGVANSLLLYLGELVLAVDAVVLPTATQLSTQGRMPELRTIFLKWSKIVLSLALMAGMFLLVLGPSFLAWWIEPSFEEPAGRVLRILTVAYLVFLPVRGVAFPILMGLGKPRWPTIAYLAASVVNLGMSIVLVRPLGLTGVALGTAVPTVLFAGFTLILACRELDISIGQYTRYVVPRAIVGSLPVFALLLWFRAALDVHNLAGLAMAGIAASLLFGVIWVGFVYRRDPYVDLSVGRWLSFLRALAR